MKSISISMFVNGVNHTSDNYYVSTGVVFRYKKFTRKVGKYFGNKKSTDRYTELNILCESLESIKESCNITLMTNSSYICQGMNVWIQSWLSNGWITKQGLPVKHQELWLKLYNLCKRHSVKFVLCQPDNANKDFQESRALAISSIIQSHCVEGSCGYTPVSFVETAC